MYSDAWVPPYESLPMEVSYKFCTRLSSGMYYQPFGSVHRAIATDDRNDMGCIMASRNNNAIFIFLVMVSIEAEQ